MTLSLSPADVTRLELAFRALLSPLDYTDGTAWRRDVTRNVRALVGSDSATLIMRETDAPLLIADGYYSHSALRDYAAHWYRHLVGEDRRVARALKVWTREEVWPFAEVRRTAYYHDFCIHNANRDSAGAAIYISPTEEVALYLNSSKAHRFQPGGREVQLLRLLHPALEAGARTALALGPHRSDWRMLDAIAGSVAIFNREGRMVHATPLLAEIFGDPVVGATIRGTVHRLAGEIRRRKAGNRDHLVCPASLAVLTPRGVYLLSATIVERPIFGSPALHLISVTQPTIAPTIVSLTLRFRLTRREAEVALLLAQGKRNQEIAVAFGTSIHTVRRQVEQVFTKLSVHARAAVPARIA